MCGAYSLVRADGVTRAKATVGQRSFDLAVVCADSRDAEYRELAETLARSGCGTVFVLPGEPDDGVMRLYDEGVQVVIRPITTAALYGAVRTAQVMTERLAKLYAEIALWKNKAETARVVGTAKCLLVERGMTEDGAHKEIERLAMEKRKTGADIAKDIIERYSQRP